MHHVHSRPLAQLLGVALLLATLGEAPRPTHAAAWLVTTAADAGPGSLRDAVAAAASGDTIGFAPALQGQTISLSSGQITIKTNLTIDGAAAPGLTVSGAGKSRVFATGFRTSVTIRNLTIANGRASGKGGGIQLASESALLVEGCVLRQNVADEGGGIQGGYKSRLTVIDSDFEQNDGTPAGSGFSAGGISSETAGSLEVRNSRFVGNRGVTGGAIYKLLGPLTVEGSTFRDNVGSDGGGAIFTDGANPAGPHATDATVGGLIAIRHSYFEHNRGLAQGGALFLYVYKQDTVLIESSTIISNTVAADTSGNAIGGGLRASSNGRLIIRASTFADNRAEQGGGLWVGESLAPVTIENSTFAGNLATGDGGVSQGAAMAFVNNTQTIDLRHVTIVHNQADFGSPAFFWNKQPQLSIGGSIVAFNSAQTYPGGQTRGTLADAGGNLEYPAPAKGAARIAAGSLVADPQLRAREIIGGALVYPLAATSPAIDLAAAGDTLSGDQRGAARDTQPDAGAFEVARRLSLSPATAFVGDPAFTLAVDGADFSAQSVIRWGGIDRQTTVVNSTRLTTQVSQAELSAAQLVQVSVSGSALAAQPFRVVPRAARIYMPGLIR